MLIFQNHGRLLVEAQPTRVFEDGAQVWSVPLCLTSPNTPFGLLANTPSNFSFSTHFWEYVLRQWALAQDVFPRIHISFIETNLPLRLSGGDNYEVKKRRWFGSGSSCPLKRIRHDEDCNSVLTRSSASFLWGLSGEIVSAGPVEEFLDKAHRVITE